MVKPKTQTAAERLAFENSLKPPTEKKITPQEFDTSSLPDYCFPEYQKLTLETYQLCIREGMRYIQVANVIGNRGTNSAVSGNVEVWSWSETNKWDTEGSMSVTFVNGKLKSKAQYNLSPDNDR